MPGALSCLLIISSTGFPQHSCVLQYVVVIYLTMNYGARETGQHVKCSLCTQGNLVQILRAHIKPGVVTGICVPGPATDRWETGGFLELLGPGSLADSGE